MKTIIIATDFSPVATNAAKYGIGMAGAIGAEIILFHSYELPVSMGEVPVVLVPVEEMKKIADEKLLALKTEMEQGAPANVKIDIVASLGDITGELQELCDKIKPFAVIMGTHSLEGLERILMGSTTLKVMHHLTWPVMSVPPGKQFGEGIKKIGFACDLQAITNTTPVNTIKELVKDFHSTLHVLHADLPTHHLRPEFEKQSHMLHSMLKEANPGFHFIQHKDIEQGISEFVEENKLDILVTIPKKYKLLENFFKGSTTNRLVLHSSIPVMCLHE